MTAKKGLPCVFCGAPSSKSGEHVIPRWFVGACFPPYDDDRQHTVEVIAADGTATLERATSEIQNYFTPMCIADNQSLSLRFEDDNTRESLLALARERRAVTGIAATKVALWLIKTVVLKAHPATRMTNQTASLDTHPASPPWNPPASHLYGWMMGAVDIPPPNGVSLWVHRRPSTSVLREPIDIFLPTVHCGDEVTVFGAHSLALGCRNDSTGDWTFVEFDVLYHPYWDIAHPLVAFGAVRLWPPAPQVIEPWSSLPVVEERVRWLYGTNGTIHVHFQDGAFGPGVMLPPIAIASSGDIATLPGVEFVTMRSAASPW